LTFFVLLFEQILQEGFMNLSNEYSTPEFEYSEYSRGGKEKLRSNRRLSHVRSGGRPAVHNGIHRRRNKRFSW
jgi:hypothetical protein